MNNKYLNNPEASFSNTELKKLLEKTLTTFQNWKLQVEKNPNPRMVHSLKNIVSIIDSISNITQRKIHFSYKALCNQMAKMLKEVASLNLVITNSLEDDDYIDEIEEKRILKRLMKVMQSATDLIQIVQEGFGMRRQAVLPIQKPALPEP